MATTRNTAQQSLWPAGSCQFVYSPMPQDPDSGLLPPVSTIKTRCLIIDLEQLKEYRVRFMLNGEKVEMGMDDLAAKIGLQW